MLSFTLGVQVYFLVFSRVLGVFMASPFWNTPVLFFRFRITLVLLLSYVLLPLAQQTTTVSAPFLSSIFWAALLLNLFLGLLIGFAVYLLFSIFRIVGELWSFQMGFSINELLDPSTGEQSAVLSQMINFLALLVFLAIGGHLKILFLIHDSFSAYSLWPSHVDYSQIFSIFGKTVAALFTNALELAMTLMGSIFMATLAVGLLAKAAPQLNVFQFGMPVYVMIGFALMVYLIPNFVIYSGNYIDTILNAVKGWILSPKGGAS